MAFIREILAVYAENFLLSCVVGSALGVLFFMAILAFCADNFGVFIGGGACSVFGASLVLTLQKAETYIFRLGVACIGIIYGAIYLLLLFCIWARRKAQYKRKMKRKEKRNIEYTLPERDNTYIRARLHTVLNPETAGFEGEETTEEKIDVGYASELLTLIRNARLTVAERLETEEMKKAFALLENKESWTNSDLRAANDSLARLLKLSAKYAV